MVIEFAKEGIYTVLMVSGPLLILALAVGLLVSIFQATTQIQEQTLAFIPKIVAVMIGMVFFGPWMLSNMVQFAANVFNNLNVLVG
nr:flagellar biosynthesis protein FliQ [Halobacillus locisalis]